MSLAAVASWLVCPTCGAGLQLGERRLACAQSHSFDVAKQGYVNLLGAPPQNADTGEMVAARERFLATGHYEPIADAVARRVRSASRLLEVGAGTGYYLARCLDGGHGQGLATDVSVAACKRAARAHDRAAAIVADTWAGLPLRGASVDALLCVFAPRNAREFFRVLTPGGALVVVTPDENHLATLRASHHLLDVRPDKVGELRRSLVGFEPIATQRVEYSMQLSADEVGWLIGMGPNAFHGAPLELADTTTRVSVHVSVFRKPQGGF